MALKAILTSLEGISEELKKEYTEKDGKFYLNIEGVDEHPSVGALKRAKQHEKDLRQTAETAQRAAEDKVSTLEADIEGLRSGAIPKADYEALKTSFATKTQEQQAAFDTKYNKQSALIEKHMLDGTALAMATEISTAPTLLIPHIRGRLKLEEVDGELTVSILDITGKPSAATLDDLKKEMLQNKTFAPILIGSKASGSGATGGSGGGSASKPFNELSEAERTKFAKDDPEGFRAALQAEQTAAASRY